MGKKSLVALIGAVMLATPVFANPGAARTARVLTQAEEVKVIEILAREANVARAQELITEQLGARAGALWAQDIRMGNTLIVGGIRALHGKVNSNPKFKVTAEDLAKFITKYPNTSAIAVAYELCNTGNEVTVASFEAHMARAEQTAALPKPRELPRLDDETLMAKALAFRGSDPESVKKYDEKHGDAVETYSEWRNRVREGKENFDTEAQQELKNWGMVVVALESLSCPINTAALDGSPDCIASETAALQWRADKEGFVKDPLASKFMAEAILNGLGHSAPSRVRAGNRNITGQALAQEDYWKQNPGVYKCYKGQAETTVVRN